MQVVLPPWTADAKSLGVLWLDAWVLPTVYTAPGGKPVMLFAAYSGDSPVLRLVMEGDASVGGAGGTYFVLTLVSSLAQAKTVKRWGPVADAGLLSVWHHLALTLRFARVGSQVAPLSAAAAACCTRCLRALLPVSPPSAS